MKKRNFLRGLTDGIPIALGYLSVSFGFGISAANLGIPTLAAILISMTNLTSAGQVAGISIIAAGGTLLEMALTQIVINIRYSLMGLSLTQKLSDRFSTPHRMLASFGITDEVFAVASSKTGPLTPAYMYGLISLPFLGWSAGTALGACAGNILPESLRLALGIAIYGMFLAIIVPPSKKSKGVALAVLAAALLSCALRYIPFPFSISQGFSVILCSLVSAVLAALLFPKKETESTEKEGGDAK